MVYTIPPTYNFLIKDSIYITPGSLGAKKEVKDQYGRTSVHYAAFFNKLKSLKYLLQSASDWSCIDAFGRTPLHWSCANKSVKALKQLLGYANSVLAQTEYIDFEGTTPVFVAVQYCNAQHIELLAKEGELNCDFILADVLVMLYPWVIGFV